MTAQSSTSSEGMDSSKERNNKSDERSDPKPLSISFCGSGFLGLYYIGVISCFRRHSFIDDKTIVCGASSGALSALSLCLDLPLHWTSSKILELANNAQTKSLGLLHPSVDVNEWIRENLFKKLPDDCHLRANGRLYLSMTRVSDGKNVFVSQYQSKEDLIQAVQCSCFVSFVSGIIPLKLGGIAYIDGAFSNNFPIFVENTITVSPFTGEFDVCPLEDYYYPFKFIFFNNSLHLTPTNIYRITKIVFADHPDDYMQLCNQGYNDALRFFLRKNMIGCGRCLSNRAYLENNQDDLTIKYKDSSESDYESAEVYRGKNFVDCEMMRDSEVLDSLPEPIVQAIQMAGNEANRGVTNCLFRQPSMKLLPILTILYDLTIDLTKVMLFQFWQQMPALWAEPMISFKAIRITIWSVVTLGLYNKAGLPGQ